MSRVTLFKLSNALLEAVEKRVYFREEESTTEISLVIVQISKAQFDGESKRQPMENMEWRRRSDITTKGDIKEPSIHIVLIVKIPIIYTRFVDVSLKFNALCENNLFMWIRCAKQIKTTQLKLLKC